MSFYPSSQTSIKELAEFLERLNKLPEYHVGYCGEQFEEIYESLLSEFSEAGIDQSFAVVTNDNKIVGALGLDINEEDYSAEVWGPFVEEANLANKLWEELNKKCGVPIRTFHFFLNEKNETARNFVLSHNGVKKGDHIILRAERIAFVPNLAVNAIPYQTSYQDSFKSLHNQAFPNTYYPSEEILGRISPTNQLFLIPDGDTQIKGYVYVEANPEHREASIEYIAVSDDFRKQGIGTQLINYALSYLFSYPEIEEITLSVGKENEIAIRLYQAAGFTIKHQLTHFVIER